VRRGYPLGRAQRRELYLYQRRELGIDRRSIVAALGSVLNRRRVQGGKRRSPRSYAGSGALPELIISERDEEVLNKWDANAYRPVWGRSPFGIILARHDWKT
jgi:hypothetical protein